MARTSGATLPSSGEAPATWHRLAANNWHGSGEGRHGKRL